MADPAQEPASPARDAGDGPGVVAAAVALRTALTAVRALTLADVARAWRVVTVDELAETCAIFGTVAAAVLYRGQRSSVRLADVWAAAFFRRPPVGLDPAPFLGIRGTAAPVPDVLAASSAFVLDALERGYGEETAMARGLYRAERLTSTEVYRAGTDAVAELAVAAGSPGWRRSTTGSACEVCRAAADGTLLDWSAELALHPHCSCVPEVVR